MTDYNIEIVHGTEVIGELDPIGARGTLYKDAIYSHLGTKYMSLELDLEKKLCYVEPTEVDYYTEAVWEGRVTMVEPETNKEMQGARVEFGFINVNKQPKLYKKIRERSYENIGYGPITLAPFEYDTTGFSFIAPREWSMAVDAADKRYMGAAYYGLSYLLRHAAPILCMADIKDIDTDVSLIECEGEEWKSALYVFDTIEGGVGYAEKVFDMLQFCFSLCMDIIEECECSGGCPSCVPPLPPGVAGEELESFLIESNASSECTRSLLTYLLRGELVMPRITVTELPLEQVIPDPVPDEERIRLMNKLNRAAKILKNKREKLH
ncbi:MAG: DUF1998 domain-containing protein [Spirochaetales bacterium]|nr:MAG: DUF1998 domain-containing protein [Spirochaetales bacterium]